MKIVRQTINYLRLCLFKFGQTFTRLVYHPKNTLVDFEIKIPPNNTKTKKKLHPNI